MKRKTKPYVSYLKDLDKRLKNQEYSAGYLNAVLNDPEADESVFLLALSDVARAHGITNVAAKAGLHRVAIHKMLRREKDPRLSSLLKILKAVHLGFSIQANPLRLAA
jgi:probable addiction module antidote protein